MRLAGLLDVIDSPGEGKGKHNSLAAGEEEGGKIEDLLWPNPTWKIKRVFSPSFPFFAGKIEGQTRQGGGRGSFGRGMFLFLPLLFYWQTVKGH